MEHYLGSRQSLRDAEAILAGYEKTEPEETEWVEEDECPECGYCDSAYDESCGMGMIRYMGRYGGVKAICADCFFDMIGWYDARMFPRTEEYEPDYEEALYILRNMIDEVTGISVVDDHYKELLRAVERVVDLRDRLDEAARKLCDVKEGVA